MNTMIQPISQLLPVNPGMPPIQVTGIQTRLPDTMSMLNYIVSEVIAEIQSKYLESSPRTYAFNKLVMNSYFNQDFLNLIQTTVDITELTSIETGQSVANCYVNVVDSFVPGYIGALWLSEGIRMGIQLPYQHQQEVQQYANTYNQLVNYLNQNRMKLQAGVNPYNQYQMQMGMQMPNTMPMQPMMGHGMQQPMAMQPTMTGFQNQAKNQSFNWNGSLEPNQRDTTKLVGSARLAADLKRRQAQQQQQQVYQEPVQEQAPVARNSFTPTSSNYKRMLDTSRGQTLGLSTDDLSSRLGDHTTFEDVLPMDIYNEPEVPIMNPIDALPKYPPKPEPVMKYPPVLMDPHDFNGYNYTTYTVSNTKPSNWVGKWELVAPGFVCYLVPNSANELTQHIFMTPELYYRWIELVELRREGVEIKYTSDDQTKPEKPEMDETLHMLPWTLNVPTNASESEAKRIKENERKLNESLEMVRKRSLEEIKHLSKEKEGEEAYGVPHIHDSVLLDESLESLLSITGAKVVEHGNRMVNVFQYSHFKTVINNKNNVAELIELYTLDNHRDVLSWYKDYEKDLARNVKGYLEKTFTELLNKALGGALGLKDWYVDNMFTDWDDLVVALTQSKGDGFVDHALVPALDKLIRAFLTKPSSQLVEAWSDGETDQFTEACLAEGKVILPRTGNFITLNITKEELGLTFEHDNRYVQIQPGSGFAALNCVLRVILTDKVLSNKAFHYVLLADGTIYEVGQNHYDRNTFFLREVELF